MTTTTKQQKRSSSDASPTTRQASPIISTLFHTFFTTFQRSLIIQPIVFVQQYVLNGAKVVETMDQYGTLTIKDRKIAWLKPIIQTTLLALQFFLPNALLSSSKSSSSSSSSNTSNNNEKNSDDDTMSSNDEKVIDGQTTTTNDESNNNNDNKDENDKEKEEEEQQDSTKERQHNNEDENQNQNIDKKDDDKEDNDSKDNSKDDSDDDEDDIGDSLFSLYIDEDYQLYGFEWNHVSFDLYHLNTASTQYDMTGQVVWPASEVLARYLIDHSESLELSSKKMLEFGAGVGLSGFAAAFAGCATTVMTDDSQNSVVERLLIKNVQLAQEQLKNRTESSATGELPVVSYEPLHWGDETDLKKITDVYGTFDILIGADTVYWPDSVIPLLTSIDVLLSHDPAAVCFLVYVERSRQTCNLLLDTARDQFNFHVEYMPDEQVDHKYNLNHVTGEKVKTIIVKRKV